MVFKEHTHTICLEGERSGVSMAFAGSTYTLILPEFVDPSLFTEFNNSHLFSGYRRTDWRGLRLVEGRLAGCLGGIHVQLINHASENQCKVRCVRARHLKGSDIGSRPVFSVCCLEFLGLSTFSMLSV